jgi:putative DNA primase/helicase
MQRAEDIDPVESDDDPILSGANLDLEDRPLYPSPQAPLDVARQLFRDYQSNGKRTLLYWRGDWMRWRGAHWSEIDSSELRSAIYDILGDVAFEIEVKTKAGTTVELRPWNPDKRKMANVMEAMAAIGHISTEIDPPWWIGVHSAAEQQASQVISCRNGLFDLHTRTRTDHTPSLFNLVSVPFDYIAKPGEPTIWLEFLASVWPEDPESIGLLQEYIGYVLSGRTDMQKMLMLIGPSRSGKGTIARMLTELVGRLHVAGPTLASMGTNFGLSPLLGKPLAIISDARLGDTPSHTVVERLLSITGEDMLTIDRKFRDPWSGKLPTRFVVLSNELPKFRDSSGAIANRMLILQMTNSFLGKEDHQLDDKIRPELPGILLWALEGLDRLTRNGKFTVPASSRDVTNLMMDLASPISAFVRERCAIGPDHEVMVDRLYETWKEWAEENGHQSGAKVTFGRNLRSVVPSLKLSQPTINGVRVRRFAGIGISFNACNEDNPVHPVQKESPRPCTGSTRADTDTKSQFNDGRTGCTGSTPFKTQPKENGHSRTGSTRATDDPCPECGHPITPGMAVDGMHPDCHSKATARAAALAVMA